MIISVGKMKLTAANAARKTLFCRCVCDVMVTQSKYDSVTPELVAPPSVRLSVQMKQMIARRMRLLKMVKCVRGRTITVHLTTDTAARCQMEHTPKLYIPLLISLSNHIGGI